ncbi:MAG: shikimate kinase [Planctomycetia bacterium]|nr:shikimate kinase [Planctomycetia bacterium]
MNLLLIGYRGTGKTTVARHIAERLGWSWLDADVELERRAGKTIAAMFAEDGEEAFRNLESEVLADVLEREQTIVALGGGVVVRERNRDLIRGRPGVVWLQAGPETLHARIEADAVTLGRRPNLTLHGGLPEIAMLLAKREPWYRECAALIVDTDAAPPEVAAEEIIARLGLRPVREPS